MVRRDAEAPTPADHDEDDGMATTLAEQWQQEALDWEDEGRLDRAAESYRTLLMAVGPRAETQFALADVLYRSGDLAAARERYYAALEIDEEYVEARASLGCVLAELGVQAHFHKVEMKPGKPVFFGTRGDTLVFGLPGNPVSSLVCFELFVRPAIERLMALPQPGPHWVQAVLQANFPYRTDRPTYHPAYLWSEGTGWQVRIVPWKGSPDLRSLRDANSFALLPAGDHVHKAGAALAVLKVE